MNRRLWAALLACLIAMPSGAFAGFEKQAAPETISHAAIPALPSVTLAAGAAMPIPSAPAGISAVAATVAPQLHAIAQPNASAEGSARAGENATRILQGGKAEAGSSSVDAGAAPTSAAAPLAAPSQTVWPVAQTPAPPSAPQGPKAVGGRLGYNARRAFLAAVSTLFGVNYSLPCAGPRLTQSLLWEASSKDAVLSDIDDTLAKYSTVISPETAAAIVAIRKAGKLFAAVTDRSDSVKPGSGQMSAFDSLASIPASERAGIVVATNGGGKIYEYQADGTPKLLYEEPAIPESQLPAVKEAAGVIKARLPQAGTEFDKEFYNPHSYGMILKAGTSEATVKALAAEFEKELQQRGVGYHVEGRMAKDPKLPPYLTFSKLDKSVAVKRIAELKGVRAKDAVILGDSMYTPKSAKTLSGLGRAVVGLAERLAGSLPLTGNAADRNMERSLPGALALGVGGTADATMKNGWVLEAKGPEMTRRVLEAMASRPSKTIAAEHAALREQRRDYDRIIAKAGSSADRVTSEYWEIVMNRRDEVVDGIIELEKKFPALGGRDDEITP